MKVIFSVVGFMLLISIIIFIASFASGFITDSRTSRSLFSRPYTIVQKALSDSAKENDISDSDEIAFRSIAKRYLSSKFQECNADGNDCKAFRGIDEVRELLRFANYFLQYLSSNIQFR